MLAQTLTSSIPTKFWLSAQFMAMSCSAMGACNPDHAFASSLKLQVSRSTHNRSQRAYFTPLIDHRQHQISLVMEPRSHTYQQFSRKMGISDSTLHRLEMGEQNVTLKTLEHLSDRLHCKISELFGEER
jgi:DNA-binding Xre family transcriptional regulator